MDIAPRKFSDAYDANSLKMNIRVKGCTQYQTHSINLGHNSPVSTATFNNCAGYSLEVKANSGGANAFMCYPYTYILKEGGVEIIKKTNQGPTDTIKIIKIIATKFMMLIIFWFIKVPTMLGSYLILFQ